jgi:N-acetylneuraminic acid mutarotase
MKTLHSLAVGLRPAFSILARRVALPLLLLIAGMVVVQPSAGQTWTETGSLNTARASHTETLLPNGKVLVACGFDGGFHAFASAELYDPASGTWAPTGSLNTARGFHTATLLPNGKVLVAGGNGLASAELYDPASGTWTATGSLATGRQLHTATLLPNGKVLAAGGFDSGFSILASAELYDPASGTWIPTGSLNTGRYDYTATLLPNGKVLVAGGGDSNGVLASAELYNPATGIWTATGSLNAGRFIHTATLLPNGKVLVAGGFLGTGDPLASAEVYDPASGTWAATGSLANGRYRHTATLLPNGKVLVAGGFRIGGGQVLASAELYDPASGTWSATGSLATARQSHTATLLPNGKVLAAGGFDSGFNALASAELYTPETVSDGCLAPPAGIVSWWSGDRTAEDLQGTNPGVLKNGASFRPGEVGPGFVFDGIDDLLTIPNSASLSQTRITLDAWIYVTGNESQNRRVIGKDEGEGSALREYSLGIDAFNKVQAFVTLPSGLMAVRGATTIQLNTWYHLAMTHDGLTLRLYVNGVQDGVLDAVGHIIPTLSAVGIGADAHGGEFTSGIIDEAQIFDRALSDAEILAIYEAGAEGQCKPDIFVASIDPSYTVSGHGFRISTSVLIQDVNGVGINGATVQLGVILPSGSTLTFPLKTDTTGQADVTFTAADSGLYQFKVRNVKHPTREYDASLNIETSDTLLIP